VKKPDEQNDGQRHAEEPKQQQRSAASLRADVDFCFHMFSLAIWNAQGMPTSRKHVLPLGNSNSRLVAASFLRIRA
jgi:hypothetical protein